MTKLIKLIQSKVNGLIFSLVFAGVIMLMLAALIFYSGFMLQLIVGVAISLIAYMLFIAAYKVWKFKDDVETHLKIKK